MGQSWSLAAKWLERFHVTSVRYRNRINQQPFCEHSKQERSPADWVASCAVKSSRSSPISPRLRSPAWSGGAARVAGYHGPHILLPSRSGSETAVGLGETGPSSTEPPRSDDRLDKWAGHRYIPLWLLGCKLRVTPKNHHCFFWHKKRQIANFKTAFNTVMPLASLVNSQEWQRW